MGSARADNDHQQGTPRAAALQPPDQDRHDVKAPAALWRTPSGTSALIALRAFAPAVILFAAMLSGCSTKSAGPTSQPSAGSASTTASSGTTPGGGGAASAQLTVDGHTHTFSAPPSCKAQTANPSGTPPSGNTEISARDDTAQFTLSWLSDAKQPLVAMTLGFKVDNGEYTMPYYPNPPNVEATQQGKTYAVKGTPPVENPSQSNTDGLPVEIHVTCP